jgi:hypothetical protein
MDWNLLFFFFKKKKFLSNKKRRWLPDNKAQIKNTLLKNSTQKKKTEKWSDPLYLEK